MPELPEVEIITRQLARDVTGAVIAEARILRANAAVADLPGAVEGRTIDRVWRRAKNILLDLSGALTLRVHLRMTGHFYTVPGGAKWPPTTRFVLLLMDGRAIILDDLRTLGRVTLHPRAELEQLLKEYGPEPLESDFTAAWLAAEARGSLQPVKTWLLDQRRVAGLGNIWAAEALHHARLHPETPIGRLRQPRLARLHEAIQSTVTRAIDGAAGAVREPSDFPEADLIGCHVYGREGLPCGTCGRAIRRITQAGRSTYFCPNCQRS